MQDQDSPWTILTITPELAAKLLANKATNRKLKPNQIEKIANDIKLDRWQVTHQGIAFNAQGQLVDGQNRLSAVVLANKPIDVWAFNRLSPRSLLKTDITISRSVCDALQISGIDVTRNDIGVLKRFMSSIEQEPASVRFASTETVKTWWLKYGESILFSSSLFSCRVAGLCNASVMAAVARAFYTLDKDEIAAFVKVFLSGVATQPREVCAIRLRDEFLRGKQGGGSQQGRLDMYLKSEKALQQYAKKLCPSKLLKASHELFPVPK